MRKTNKIEEVGVSKMWEEMVMVRREDERQQVGVLYDVGDVRRDFGDRGNSVTDIRGDVGT